MTSKMTSTTTTTKKPTPPSSPTPTAPCCSICDNTTTLSNQNIKCEYCSFEACRKCSERFILSQSYAKCMNIGKCDKEWTRKFIVANFPKVFVGKRYKEYKENILYEKEKALFQETQIAIEEEREAEALEKRNNQIRYTNNLLRSIFVSNRDTLRTQKSIRQEVNRGVLLEEEIIKHITLPSLEEIEKNIENNDRRLTVDFVKMEVSKKQHAKRFVRACPATNCHGFLSTHFKCGLCEVWVCPDCHVVKGKEKDAEHTCDPDTVATVKMIASDTRQCPKCSEGIFKIDGCDQMWCTQCKTAFSWTTGKIETKIHNPHYYEWLRRTKGSVPRDPNDIVGGGGGCGGGEGADEIGAVLERNVETIMDVVQTVVEPLGLLEDDGGVSGMIRTVAHFRYAEIPRYRTNGITNNERLRREFMMNKINETKFKLTLQRDNKKYEKYTNMYDVLTLFTTALTDIIMRYYHTCRVIYDNDKYNNGNKYTDIINHTPQIRNHRHLTPLQRQEQRLQQHLQRQEQHQRQQHALRNNDHAPLPQTPHQTAYKKRLTNIGLNERDMIEIDYNSYIKEIDNLISYVNECLVEISNVYNSVCYQIKNENKGRAGYGCRYTLTTVATPSSSRTNKKAINKNNNNRDDDDDDTITTIAEEDNEDDDDMVSVTEVILINRNEFMKAQEKIKQEYEDDLRRMEELKVWVKNFDGIKHVEDDEDDEEHEEDDEDKEESDKDGEGEGDKGNEKCEEGTTWAKVDGKWEQIKDDEWEDKK